MSSLKRPTKGEVLFHRLRADELTLDASLLATHGRTARTLVKEGPLRLTLMGVAAGGAIPEHHADGPVSIQVMQGDVEFTAAGNAYPMVAGDILVFAPGLPHSARSAGGCVLLLTVVQATQSDDHPDVKT